MRCGLNHFCIVEVIYFIVFCLRDRLLHLEFLGIGVIYSENFDIHVKIQAMKIVMKSVAYVTYLGQSTW